MSGDVSLRRPRSDETDRIRQVAREAMRETPEWVPDAPDEDLRDVTGHYLDVDGCEFLVGVLRDDIVATGAYVPLDGWMTEQFDVAGPAAEISRMRVHPDYQGQGIGSAVYDELESRARADRYGVLVLNTGVDNEPARGFYEARGFDSVQDLAVDFDGLTLDLALYRKSIE